MSEFLNSDSLWKVLESRHAAAYENWLGVRLFVTKYYFGSLILFVRGVHVRGVLNSYNLTLNCMRKMKITVHITFIALIKCWYLIIFYLIYSIKMLCSVEASDLTAKPQWFKGNLIISMTERRNQNVMLF